MQNFHNRLYDKHFKSIIRENLAPGIAWVILIALNITIMLLPDTRTLQPLEFQSPPYVDYSLITDYFNWIQFYFHNIFTFNAYFSTAQIPAMSTQKPKLVVLLYIIV